MERNIFLIMMMMMMMMMMIIMMKIMMMIPQINDDWQPVSEKQFSLKKKCF